MSELRNSAGGEAGRPAVLAALWRSRTVVAVVAIVAGVVGYQATLLSGTSYTSTARVVLSQTAPFNPLGATGGGEDADRFLATQAVLMTSGGLLETASAAAGVEATAVELGEAVVASADAVEGDTIVVTATGSSAAEAAARADAVVAAYRATVLEQVTAAEALAVQARQAGTEAAVAVAVDDGGRSLAAVAGAEDVAAITARADVYGDGVALAEPGTTDSDPSTPSPWLVGLLSLLAGAVVAGALAVLTGGRRRRDVTADLRAQGAPVLGTVEVARGPRPPLEALAGLVSLQYRLDGAPGPVHLSGLDGSESVADVALGLGAAAARQGRRALVLGLEGETALPTRAGTTGLRPLPQDMAEPGDADLHRVALSPAAGTAPGELRVAVLSDRLVRGGDVGVVLAHLAATHDLVLVAAAPVATSALSYALVREAPVVLGVARSEGPSERRASGLRDLRSRLAVAGRALDGVIVTRRAHRPPASPSGTPGAPAQPGPAQPGPAQPGPATGGTTAGGSPAASRPVSSGSTGSGRGASGAGPAKTSTPSPAVRGWSS